MKNLLEYNEYLDSDSLLEMANITQKTTGIKDVVIWIGPNPPQHGKRIKVSNKPNSFNINDTFTITLPKLEIIGDINSKFIKPKTLDEIIHFITKNIDVINDYSDSKISTEDLIENIEKVN